VNPRLRDHIEIEPRAGGARLHDRLLGHAFDFGPVGAALLARADGTRSVAELAATPDEATILRRLFLLDLVEGAGDGMVARLRRVLSGELPLELQVLEGARFQCQGSGECCQNYVFGPLEDEDIARLEALPIAEHWPHLAGAPLFETTNQGGFELRYLKSRDERCVFLEDDRRCGLHRRFGADAKPALCRIYPIEHLATYDGLRLYDKGSCGSFAISARSGPSIVDDLPRIRALLPKRPLGLSHPAVIVDEYPCDFGHFDRLLKAALGLVKRGLGSASETLRAISRGARGFAGVLRSFPLEAGEPDASLDRFFEPDAARWYEGEPTEETVRAGAAFYAEVFGALLASAANVLGEELPKTGHLSLRLVREGAQLFHLCASATTMALDPAAPIDEYLVKALAVPVSDPEVDEVLRISLRQQLFGTGSLVESRFMPALVRMALTQILAVTGARLRAHEDGRTEARAADLSWGHMLASRVLVQPQAAPVLLATEDRMTELLEALPLVLKLDYAGTRRPMP
jgi:Fe-S-cluster containining protein